MTTYIATKSFTIYPGSILVNIGDSLIKYADSISVKVGTTTITYITFYNWLGSTASLEYFAENPASEPDDGGGSGGALTPINLASDFTTTDIVNKINAIIAEVNA